MSSTARADRGFLRSARTVSGFTLLSRVLGMLRDMATAHILGGGLVNDALTYAWTVPNAFRRLFGEGALGTAFVPVLTRALERDGTAGARRVASEVVSGFGAFLVVLSGLLVVLVGLVPEDMAAGLLGGPEKARLTLDYVQLLLPYLAVVCVIAQLMAILNAAGEFAVPAFAPVILNVVWLAGVGVAALAVDGSGEPAQGTVIAGAILLASVLQLLVHLPRLSALGLGLRLVRPRRTAALGEVVALMGPMLLGMGAAQLNVVADRTIAMAFLDDGGATHLYYGLRVMQFPLGLVSVALVTAVFPAMARLATRNDSAGLAATASLALRTNLLVAVPAAVGLAVLARPIVGFLFEGGAFAAASADRTGRALLGYAFGVPFAGSAMLLTRACYATGEVAAPVRVGLSMVVVNVALDLALVRWGGELGLGLATSVTAVLQSVLLLRALRRHTGVRSSRTLVGGTLPVVAVGLVMGGAVAVLDAQLAPLLADGRSGAGLRVLAGMALGVGVFVTLASRVCPAEWGEIARLWSRDQKEEGPPNGPGSGA